MMDQPSNENEDITNQVSKTGTSKKQRTREEDINMCLEEFGEDAGTYDLDKNITREVLISTSNSSMLMHLHEIIEEGVYEVSGYTRQPQKDKEKVTYKLTKEPMATENVLKQFRVLLSSHSNTSNLIAKKTWEVFAEQVRNNWETFESVCLKDRFTPERYMRTVQNKFKDCLINIGDIICDNPKNMDSLFGSISNEESESDIRTGYN